MTLQTVTKMQQVVRKRISSARLKLIGQDQCDASAAQEKNQTHSCLIVNKNINFTKALDLKIKLYKVFACTDIFLQTPLCTWEFIYNPFFRLMRLSHRVILSLIMYIGYYWTQTICTKKINKTAQTLV